MMNHGDGTYDSAAGPKPRFRAFWCLLAAAAAALLLLLGRNALVSSEGATAECVRELLRFGELSAVPEVWQPDAPGTLFFARIAALPAKFCGVSEWLLRLPAAVAALLLLTGTMLLADRCADRGTGFTAGWLLAGSYGFLYWGRHASWHLMPAAMLVWFAATLADRGERDFLRLAAAETLALTGAALWGWFFLLPAAAVLPLGWDHPRRNPAVTHLGAATAAATVTAVLLILLTCSPELPIARNLRELVHTEHQVWRTSRILAVWPGHRAWYNSLENLPRMLLPWVPLTATALAGLWRRRGELPPRLRELLYSAGLLILLTGLFPGRRWQYQLTQLPVFIALTAAGLSPEWGRENWNVPVGRAMGLIFALLGALAVSVVMTYPLWDLLLNATPPLAVMAGVPLLGLLALALLVFDSGPGGAEARFCGMPHRWSGMILAGLALGVALWCVVIPSLTRFRGGRPFWRRCGMLVRKLPAENVILAGDFPGAGEMYYLDLPGKFAGLSDPGELRRHLPTLRSGSAAVVIQRRDRDRFAAAARTAGWEFRERPELSEGTPLRLWGRGESEDKLYDLYFLESVKYGGVSHAERPR